LPPKAHPGRTGIGAVTISAKAGNTRNAARAAASLGGKR